MLCKDCPLSLICMSGRLHDVFMLVALCPLCGRLYLIQDPIEEQEHISRHEQQRQQEAAKHGIDLSYEGKLRPHVCEHEYLGEFVPTPRNTMFRLKCEQHKATPADKRRWNRNKPEGARYRYSQGWIADGMNYRPCPECVKWPEPYIVEDLDEQATYEEEKARAQPAFRLKNRR